jgi:serine/threonine-protein kinase
MGTPLGIVHRDVSPQNIMVATDGSARLLDFGVAKATMAAHITRAGTFKGKLAYSAPEHVRGNAVQQSDVYSLSVVLWELLVGHRLHNNGQAEAELITEIMTGRLPTITQALAAERDMMGAYRWNQLLVLEPIIQKGLAVRVEDRWQTASEMEEALAEALPPASSADVGQWLKALGKEFLEGREKMIAAEEASWRRAAPPTSTRATSQPGRTSRAGILSGSMVSLQKKRTKYAIGAMFAVLLVFGVAFAMRGGESAQVATATKTEPAPAPAVAQPVVTPLPAAPVVHDATVAREPAATDDVKAATAPAAPKPRIVRAVRQQQVQRSAPVRATPVATKPTPAPVAAAPAPAKDDCNPPYYFEGRKKIFKSACL